MTVFLYIMMYEKSWQMNVLHVSNVVFLYTYAGPGKATYTTLHSGSPTTQQGTQQIHQHIYPCELLGVCDKYKWKNHFYEMKGDVGMSVHEKERKQEDAYTKTQTHS